MQAFSTSNVGIIVRVLQSVLSFLQRGSVECIAGSVHPAQKWDAFDSDLKAARKLLER